MSMKLHLRIFLLLTCIFSGIFVGLLTCSSKLTFETIKLADNPYLNPFVYLLIICNVLCIVGSLYNLNLLFKRFSQLYVLPISEACLILANLLSGGIIMAEFKLYSYGQLILVFLGCFISLLGIFVKMSKLEAYELKGDNLSTLMDSQSDVHEDD